MKNILKVYGMLAVSKAGTDGLDRHKKKGFETAHVRMAFPVTGAIVLKVLRRRRVLTVYKRECNQKPVL